VTRSATATSPVTAPNPGPCPRVGTGVGVGVGPEGVEPDVRGVAVGCRQVRDVPVVGKDVYALVPGRRVVRDQVVPAVRIADGVVVETTDPEAVAWRETVFEQYRREARSPLRIPGDDD